MPTYGYKCPRCGPVTRDLPLRVCPVCNSTRFKVAKGQWLCAKCGTVRPPEPRPVCDCGKPLDRDFSGITIRAPYTFNNGYYDRTELYGDGEAVEADRRSINTIETRVSDLI